MKSYQTEQADRWKVTPGVAAGLEAYAEVQKLLETLAQQKELSPSGSLPQDAYSLASQGHIPLKLHKALGYLHEGFELLSTFSEDPQVSVLNNFLDLAFRLRDKLTELLASN